MTGSHVIDSSRDRFLWLRQLEKSKETWATGREGAKPDLSNLSCCPFDIIISQYNWTYLRGLLPILLRAVSNPTGHFHLPDLPLQLSPGPLAVFEPILCVPQSQQLLLQEAVLSLQKRQFSDGRQHGGFPMPSVSPQRAPHITWRHSALCLQQQLQD